MASPLSDKLISQPHPRRANHQARANQQEGSYPLCANYLCYGKGESGEQYGACHEEGEKAAHRSSPLADGYVSRHVCEGLGTAKAVQPFVRSWSHVSAFAAGPFELFISFAKEHFLSSSRESK
jgi:hypothetical protein